MVPGVPRISGIGLFPTLESIGAQLLVLAALVVGFRAAARLRPEPVPAE